MFLFLLGIFHKVELLGPKITLGASKVALVVKNPPASAGDVTDGVFNPWVRKIPWRRAWQPTCYSCLKSPMDRGAWWATVHRVTKSQTQLQ